MKAVCFIFLFLFCSLSSYAQVIGFEEKVPETFKVSGKGEVKLSSLFYKEGESSLEWDFQPASTLDVQIEPLSLNAKKEQQFGITLWIYNEKPQQDSIRFEFLNKAGEVSYWFTYHLQAAGWRACWISFAYMNGDKKDKNIVSYRLVAPDRKGRIFLDRLTFPEKKMNLRTTPNQLTDGLETMLKPLEKIKVPVHDFAMMMSLALRFIPILLDEANRIISAQSSRGADFDEGNLLHRMKMMVSILVPLLVSATRRAYDLAMAMESRCYHGGDGRTKMKPLKYKKTDKIMYGVVVGYLAVVIVVTHVIPTPF